MRAWKESYVHLHRSGLLFIVNRVNIGNRFIAKQLRDEITILCIAPRANNTGLRQHLDLAEEIVQTVEIHPLFHFRSSRVYRLAGWWLDLLQHCGRHWRLRLVPLLRCCNIHRAHWDGTLWSTAGGTDTRLLLLWRRHVSLTTTGSKSSCLRLNTLPEFQVREREIVLLRR